MIENFWTCKLCNEHNSIGSDNCNHCHRPRIDRQIGALNVSSIPLSTDIAKQEIKLFKPLPFDGHDTETPVALPKKKGARSQKWHYKGVVLDSTTEKNRMLYLEAMERRGIISDLARPSAIEIRPALVIPANPIHPKFTQSKEVYTPDFAYRWEGHFVLEDVKAGRKTDKLKKLKPRVQTADVNKYKNLQAMLISQPRRVFLLVVESGSQWHYFNSNQQEIEFDLEQIEEAA